MNVSFYDRKFTKPITGGLCAYDVQWLSWAELGGPDRGRLYAFGPMASVQQLPTLLRCPVTITDENGQSVWWGYINEVELHLDGVVYLVSLDGMANRIAVRWREETNPGPLTSSPGYTSQSFWEDNVYSQNEYGVKEMIFDIGEGRPAEAVAARKTQLLKRFRPPTQSKQSERNAQPWAYLRLAGWWHTIGWRFYANDRGYVGNVQFQGVEQAFGGVAASTKLKQTVVANGSAAWETAEIWVRIWKFGGPADNVIFELCADGGGGVPGTVLATQTVSSSALLKEPGALQKIIWSSPYTLTNGTTYVLQVRRSGANDANNYYKIKVCEDLGAVNGTFALWTGAAWAARNPDADLLFGLMGQEETTNQIKNILAAGAGGQFLTGVIIRQVASVKTRCYRPGKLRADEELLEMLRVGTSAGDELSAKVNEARVLIIDKRPAQSTAELMIYPTGEIRHESGRALLGSESPVGRWARVLGLDNQAGEVTAAGVVYITRAEWDSKSKILKVSWE